MALKNWQKIKLVLLVELLRQESDEQHPLTTEQICDYMVHYDIPCDRRIVSKDVSTLNDLGIEVLVTRIGKKKGYYVEDRSFSTPELKILIDAVQAANFITEKKTDELIDKLASLGGSHSAEILKSNLVCFNTRKHSNKSIYYNVGALEDALQRNKKVIFLYYDIDINHEKNYRRDGHHYVVEPVALVYNEDNYYLVAYSSRHDNTANYRVDRMEHVDFIDEDISEKAVDLRSAVSEYTDQAFKMYGGPKQTVTLEFDSRLIGAVYDRFGEKISMTPSGEDKAVATVEVQLSPTFWGWLFQFGKQMRVIAPDAAVQEQRKRIQELMEY
ncbi:MAG: WYL domain-containing protein [Lachnospiraceae bacterium]|nr:WYL domain-containing protein [Lachnospiraceae bacterium]